MLYLFRLLIVLLSLLAIPLSAQARQLQIIHTNDLHALFETHENGRGGLAQVKAAIDQVKAQASQAGIDSVTLDAGDFSDGSIYRYSFKGEGPLRVLDAMGFDAAAIGNHDWLINTDNLNEIFEAVKPRTPFVASNFKFNAKQQPDLAKSVLPYIEIERAGIKIAIIGVTTNSIIYQWIMEKGTITSGKKAVKSLIKPLRARNDLVIVLSHMGLKKDRKLASNVEGIDLVVGGHSHDLLTAPLYEKISGRRVPIVQAGAHGEQIGSMLIDVSPGQPHSMQILKYEIVPVKTDGPKDPQLLALIQEARMQLDAQYGPGWLDQNIGYSPVPMEPPRKHATYWGTVYAEAMMETAQTHGAIDFAPFYGTPQPAGPVTRAMLFNFYPRTFDVNRPLGWTIWRTKIPGFMLKALIGAANKFGSYANTAGITYKVKKKGKIKITYDFHIGGKKLRDYKVYTIAIPEGIGRGMSDISKYLRTFFRPIDTGIPIWSAVEQKLQSTPLP